MRTLTHYNKYRDLDDALMLEDFRTVSLSYRIEFALFETRKMLNMPINTPAPVKPELPLNVSNYNGSCIQLCDLWQELVWEKPVDGMSLPLYESKDIDEEIRFMTSLTKLIVIITLIMTLTTMFLH